MSRPHAAQIRLLSFLAIAPGTQFVSLGQMEQARQIRSGDDLFVPSLIARGWAEMGPERWAAVRITEAGRSALVDPENVSCQERKA